MTHPGLSGQEAPPPGEGGSGFTLRAVALGLALVLLICLGAPYSIWMVGSSEITWSFFPICVGLPFVLLVLANGLVRRWLPQLALRAPESITIVTMGLVATGIPIFIVGLLLAIPSKPYYGATPENEWAQYIQPYLPNWAIPSPDGDAMRHFYEGLPSGMPIPYEAWLAPLGWWLSLIFAVYFICFCIVVILRRQWVEHERLVFPVTEVPRLLTEEREGAALPPIMQDRLFWLGCALPVIVMLFNCISYFKPGFPTIAIHEGMEVQVFDGAPPVVLKLYFPVMGFVYLIGTPISFSIWFFYLVAVGECALLSWMRISTLPAAFVSGPMMTLGWQSSGAFVTMVLVSLWMARRHLAAVMRTVFCASGEVDDAEEMMSYRAAVLGGLIASLYVVGWLWKSGMGPGLALLFLAGTLVAYIGMTRLVVQSGVHYLTSPFSPQYLAVAITGSAISPYSLVALALSYSWCSDIQSIFMAAAAHGARLNELSRQRRRLGIAIALAVVVGFVGCILFILHLGYRYGAGNFRSWYFASGAGAGGRALDQVTYFLANPAPPDMEKLGLFGIGAVAYGLLALCHYRFYWWPLHPVGLAMASLWNLRITVASVFLAWAFKTLTLRLGGVGLYRQLRPLFIGLIVGFFLGVGISYGIDVIWFFGKGHPILHG